jgi:hypothetical protein
MSFNGETGKRGAISICPRCGKSDEIVWSWATDVSKCRCGWSNEKEVNRKQTRTNREWLQSLSDQELSEFLTVGIELKFLSMPVACVYNIREIASRYTQSTKGLEKWLAKEQEFMTIDEWRTSDE